VQDLLPFARLRDCPFDWELSEYSKTRRAQAADRTGLVRYADPLKVVLHRAPGGFPNHKLLVAVWMSLHKAHGIMDSNFGKKPVLDWAGECADMVRLCCRHLVELKRSKTTLLATDLKELVSLVKDGEGGEASSSSMVAAEPNRPPVRKRVLAPQASCSSVEFCGAKCNCEKCKPLFDVISSDADEPSGSESCGESVRSDTSLAAAQNKQSVPAARGGQRKAAEAVRKGTKRPLAPPPLLDAEQPAAVANVKVVNRNTPPEKREAYILSDGHYVCTLRQSRCPKYKEIIEQVAVEMRSGAIGDKIAAKARVEALIAAAE